MSCFESLDDKKDEFSAHFWQVSETENDKFHNQIRNENQKFFRLDRTLEENELNSHFIVTNVGRLKSSIKSESSIRVTRSFTCVFLGSKEALSVVNLISCVEDQINWVVSFNSQHIDESIIEELVQNYFEILNMVI